MKISELMNQLRDIMDEHGDLPVRYESQTGEISAREVSAYNKDGNTPRKDNEAIEAFIH